MTQQPFRVSDLAIDKLVALRTENNREGYLLRVAIRGRGPMGFLYQLGFVDPSNVTENDTLIRYEALDVCIDPDSYAYLEGSTLHFVEEQGQQGFQIDNPNPLWHDAVALKIQEVLDTRINPSIAMHGGFVSLQSVEDGIAYVILGGGCQGCGMAKVTLSQGIDVMIREMVPEVQDVVDVTDHAQGTNPFYRTAEAGASPLGH